MYLTFLSLTFSTILSQIQVTPIEKLLTSKLGTTQHEFILYVNLQPIQNKLKITELQLESIKAKIMEINNQFNDAGFLTFLILNHKIIRA